MFYGRPYHAKSTNTQNPNENFRRAELKAYVTLGSLLCQPFGGPMFEIMYFVAEILHSWGAGIQGHAKCASSTSILGDSPLASEELVYINSWLGIQKPELKAVFVSTSSKRTR